MDGINMTREEKIDHIAGLVDIVPKQDTTDYTLTDEELHIRTLNELEKLTDDELDIVIDKIWNVIIRVPLPESL